jgi:hypothetical protein
VIPSKEELESEFFMFRPVFCVDFNEMVSADTVLLSAEDIEIDALGRAVKFYDGMPVSVYMDDLDEKGLADNLIADGVVVRNTASDWSTHVKWCCRIGGDGIQTQSKQVSSS